MKIIYIFASSKKNSNELKKKEQQGTKNRLHFAFDHEWELKWEIIWKVEYSDLCVKWHWSYVDKVKWDIR